MTKEQICAVLARVRSWPQEDQEELAEVAREIEARRTGVYVMDSDERAAVREGAEQARRGEFVPYDEMDAFWTKLCEALARSAEDIQQRRFATDDEIKTVSDRYRS